MDSPEPGTAPVRRNYNLGCKVKAWYREAWAWTSSSTTSCFHLNINPCMFLHTNFLSDCCVSVCKITGGVSNWPSGCPSPLDPRVFCIICYSGRKVYNATDCSRRSKSETCRIPRCVLLTISERYLDSSPCLMPMLTSRPFIASQSDMWEIPLSAGVC